MTSIPDHTPKGELLRYFNEQITLETDDCIEWIYAKCKGYGQIQKNGKNQYVHRMALSVRVGPPPIDKPQALHGCHNPACFNYRHLRWGSNKDNSQDKLADGTSRRGELNPGHKLTEKDIIHIRNDDRINRVIAKDYGVHRITIGDVKLRKTWYWV